MSARVSTSAILASVVGGLAFVVTPAEVGAQPAGPTSNDYTLDLYQGPILASIRTTSMAGAYAGYAQGLDGFTVNAAAPAVRHSHSTSWVDVDVDASISIPIVFFEQNDVDNSGDRDDAYQGYVYVAAGTNVQIGNFGIGVFADLQHYSVAFPPAEATTAVAIGRYHLLAAYQFFGGQLVVGGGARAHSLGVGAAGRELGMFGAAPEAGFLIKPDWAPFRVGWTYRHAVGGLFRSGAKATVDAGVGRAGGIVVPGDITMPWEVTTGVAFQIGPRPLNPRWLDPHEHEREFDDARAERVAIARRRRATRLDAIAPGPERDALAVRLQADADEQQKRTDAESERDRRRLESERRAILTDWPREYLLVTADLLVTGAVDKGVSLEQFIGQGKFAPVGPCQVVASGPSMNFSPRVGLEFEPVPNRLRARLGSYYEPTRFQYAPEPCNDRVGRQHFTFGADVKAFSTTWFGLASERTYKVQFYGDFAPRYQSLGAGLGAWY